MTSDHLRRVKRAKKKLFWSALDDPESFNPRLSGQVYIAVDPAHLPPSVATLLRRYPYGSQAKGQPRRASGYIA